MLTREERQRFATYLENDVMSMEAISEQLGKLKGTQPIIERYKVECAAAKIIIHKLRSVEEQTI